MERANSQRFREWGVVVLIVLLAAVLRFYDLRALPPGLWYDEAINGLDAQTILRDKVFPIFFTTEQHPREPLFMYLIALAFKLFGVSGVVLRGTSGVIGVATVPLVYLFVKELGRWRDKNFVGQAACGNSGRRLAILSMLTFAVLRWHFHFSRLGFRTILAPLLTLLCFLFFLRALRTRQGREYVFAGVFLGLGFYGYLSFRFVPVILLCVLLYLYVRRGALTLPLELPEGRHVVVMLVVALVIFSPLLVDYVMNPWHFFGRAQEVTLFGKGFIAGVKAVASQAWDVARMFSFKGDHVSKHNIPYMPVFGNFISPFRGFGDLFARKPLFGAIGFPMALFAALLIASHSILFYTGLIRAVARARRDAVSFLLVCWFFVMLLTTIFSFGAPNLLRAQVLTPVVAIFFADGLNAIVSRVAQKASSLLIWLLMVLFVGSFGILEVQRYFVLWRDDPATWQGFNTAWDDLALTIARLPEGQYDVYVPPDIYHHPTFKFETNGTSGIFPLELPGALARRSDADRDRIVVATSQTAIYGDLRRLYPGGRDLFTLYTPQRTPWAIGYLIPHADLLPLRQTNL